MRLLHRAAKLFHRFVLWLGKLDHKLQARTKKPPLTERTTYCYPACRVPAANDRPRTAEKPVGRPPFAEKPVGRPPSENGACANGKGHVADGPLSKLGFGRERDPGVCGVDTFESVAVVGLGKLGLPLACVLAAKGCRVCGIDTQQPVVDAVNRGEYAGPEPHVADLLRMSRNRLTAATRFSAIGETEAAFIVVPTPSDDRDRFSLEFLLPAVRAVAERVAEAHSPRYTIVVVSTVMPGACEQEIWPAIVEASGVRRGAGIDLAYCPEFVALGDVVRGMVRPDLVLVGASSQAASDAVAEFLLAIVSNSPAFVQTSFASAEAAKLGLNALVAMKVTSANLLAEICQQLPGADIDMVTEAIGADPRIGPKYLRGGLGFGGPCFPRDVRALSALCREVGVEASLPDSVTDMNDGLPVVISELAHRVMRGGGAVAVLGLAYRTGTNIVEGAQAVEIARRLTASGSRVYVYDPLLWLEDVPQLAGLGIVWCASVQSACAHADTIVIAGQHETFRTLDASWLDGKTVVDCWRQLPDETVTYLSENSPGGFRYVAWGRNPEQGSLLPISARQDFEPATLCKIAEEDEK